MPKYLILALHFLRLILIGLSLDLGLTAVQAQTTNVTARDPRITYIGNWVDQDQGGHKFTGSIGASFSFSFKGNSISWIANREPGGGVSQVRIDSGTSHIIDASSGTSPGDNPVVTTIFTQSGLDGTQTHTFNVSYVGPGALGGPYVTIFLLQFAEQNNPNSGPSTLQTGGVVPIATGSPKVSSKTITRLVTSVTTPSTLQSSRPESQASNSIYTTTNTTATSVPGSFTPTTSSTDASIQSTSSSTSVPGAGPTSQDLSSTGHSHTPLILGAVLGPCLAFLVAGVLGFYIWRRKKSEAQTYRSASPFQAHQASNLVSAASEYTQLATPTSIVHSPKAGLSMSPTWATPSTSNQAPQPSSPTDVFSSTASHGVNGDPFSRFSESDLGTPPPRYSGREEAD